MNTLGHLKCPYCQFGAFTRAGLNTHMGKKHASDSASPVRTRPSGEVFGDPASPVRVCDVEGAEVSSGGAGRVERTPSVAEQRASFEKTWPSAAVYQPTEEEA